jgi:hypothetical protein
MAADDKKIRDALANEVGERARKNGTAKSNASYRRRKHEADPETLHPDDRPTGVKLRVDPIAVADLAKAMGFTR